MTRRDLQRRYWFTGAELDFYERNLGAPLLDDFHERYLSKRAYQGLRPDLDELPWNVVLHNKWLFATFAAANGLAVPETYGLLGRAAEGGTLTSGADLVRLVRDRELREFLLKHIGGGSGDSVYVVTVGADGGRAFELRGASHGPDWVDQQLDREGGGLRGWIVQHRVPPHPEVEAITGGGLTSLRINTLRLASGDCVVQRAYVRLGLVSGRTDHLHQGAVYAPVEDGRMRSGFTLKGGAAEWTSEHPVTRARFDGEDLPHWEDAVGIALQAASALPGVHAVGWDVVIGPDGAFVIEGNLGWPIHVYQLLWGGLLSNGMAEAWRAERGAWLPDGSVAWRRQHRYRGRRLTPFEALLASARR